ncbi:DUF411 domain-containing protein [Phenylobacterium sp.]|uniref:DUF411 domain-containing protein n=1 Tax=Phenylobacterium sp. TaxID=1871053 RepID=UPI0035AE4148
MTEARHALPRRRLLLAAPVLLLPAGCARAAPRELAVFKTPWCGCCKGWLAHMTRAGFTAQVTELEDLAPVRERYGVPFQLSSCHTAVIGGYVVEGHVPPADVQRLLKERPKAIGLTVPGMPLGSPGMELPDGTREAFETLLLLDRQGRTAVFARHA